MDLLIKLTPILVMLVFATVGYIVYLRTSGKARGSEKALEKVPVTQAAASRTSKKMEFNAVGEEEEEYTTRNPTLSQAGGLPPMKQTEDTSIIASLKPLQLPPEVEAENKALREQLQDLHQLRESLKKVLDTPLDPQDESPQNDPFSLRRQKIKRVG